MQTPQKTKSAEITGEAARKVVEVARKIVGGALTVTDLAAAIHEHSLPYARVTRAGRLRCPGCRAYVPKRAPQGSHQASADFRWVEDIGNRRRVLGLEGTTVVIDGYYETNGFDEDGEAGRLFCCGCNTEFVLPEGFEPECV